MVDASLKYINSHSISPEKVLRGQEAWIEGKKLIPRITRNPLLIGRSKGTSNLRTDIYNDLKDLGLNITRNDLLNDCCESDLIRLQKSAVSRTCDGVIAAGGGKVLDAGKLLAYRLELPCITIPLSAATCAGWTAIANIYSPEGSFIKDQVLDQCPNLLIFDHGFVQKAPPRTLASGIADGLAKWYEASVSSGSSKDGLVQQAVQMARVLRDQLMIEGQLAIENPNSDAWKNVAESCALTAGLIGGIGGACCRTVAAHAVHNGLTQLQASNKMLHGEKVGYGILVQLRLEEILSKNQLAGQARQQLIHFLKKLSLPTSLEELGLEKTSINELKQVCVFACRKESEISFLPFKVTPDAMLDALLCAGMNNQDLTHQNKLKAIKIDH